ncbi:MAG: hypothetical protein QOE92_1934 [Chloroflexota bacterium]|nr:hypothetical protein [Chloroflexota bacterium]
MKSAGLSTRARAWFLRTFRGRSREDAAWDREAEAVSSPPESFALGDLRIDALPRGIKAAGANPASAVYEVVIALEGDPRKWSSRYGLPPADNSARAAVEIALDELDQAWRDPGGWREQALAGMSEDEREAMEDSPMFRLDLRAAEWVGPHLDRVRESREATGAWLPA